MRLFRLVVLVIILTKEKQKLALVAAHRMLFVSVSFLWDSNSVTIDKALEQIPLLSRYLFLVALTILCIVQLVLLRC